MPDITKLPIITISREYYAGGRSVAKALAEELNIPWYDHDFVKLASKISGYSEEEVWAEGEELSKLDKLIDAMLSSVNLYTSSHDEINRAEKEAVLEIAKKPGIIVGRAANAILRDAGIPSFDVFLYASKDVRVKRFMDKHSKEYEEALKSVEGRDHLRTQYYEKYTGRKYADSRDYTVCIDTGVIDYQKSTDIIVSILNNLYA